MPLQTTGAISISQIRTQFGSGAAPHAISEYYAGAASGFVPALTEGTNGPIPTTGNAIKLSDFYGAPLNVIITCGTYGAFIPPMGLGAGQAESGYNAAGYGNSAYGSISSNTVQGKTIVTLLTQAVTPPKGMGAITYNLIFAVAGDQTAWTWNTLTVPDGTVYTRTGSVAGAGYNSTYDFTRWYWDTSSTGPENMCGSVTIT